MLLKSTSTAVLVSALAVIASYTHQAEAHSWLDCVDWRFNNPSSHEFPNPKGQDWSAKGGKCFGYARRFPFQAEFGSLDSASPSRHYQQPGNPNKAPPCSDMKHGKDKDVGSNETRADPPELAYAVEKGGPTGDEKNRAKWGPMTVTKAGAILCLRWPAKNHAKSNEADTTVQINFSDIRDGPDPDQEYLLTKTLELDPKMIYKNCNKGSNEDRRPCGGCFPVPDNLKDGTYLMQWRWMLNKGEWYTSCADIKIEGGSSAPAPAPAGGKGASKVAPNLSKGASPKNKRSKGKKHSGKGKH